jgi:hypothetical protein
MIDGNKHLIKYSYRHSFTGVFYCDKCHKFFKLNQIFYKQPKRVKDVVLIFNFCLPCAKKLGLMD